MSFIGHTPEEEAALLAEIGVGSFEELIAQVPARLREHAPVDLPPGQTEGELRRELLDLARRSYDPLSAPSFLGAGFYDHEIPSLVDQIALRSEFYTAYTPYQAEVAQGTLGVIFEFQTLIAELTGLEAANASMYDGGSAAAEALLLAAGATGARRVLLAPGVHPRTQGVIATYLAGSELVIETLPEREGRVDAAALKAALSQGPAVAGLLLQQPNFYGLIEAADEVSALVQLHAPQAHLVVSADPLSLALLASPGELGATTAVGDLQPLGIPVQFGGPSAGYFATRAAHLRRMPGRLAAEAHDAAGRRGFVLTLQTREQHIRREKATSNICTNSALMALRATVFLSLLGPRGLREMAAGCLARSHHALEGLLAIPGVTRAHPGAFFREFVLRLPADAAEVVARVRARSGILAGVPLSRFDPGRRAELLVAVTEKRTPEEIAGLQAALREALA